MDISIMTILAALMLYVVGAASAQDGGQEWSLQMFKHMDKNDDGILEKDEMLPWMKEQFIKMAITDSQWLFNMNDGDNDGYLTKGEIFMNALLKSSGKTEAQLLKAFEDNTASKSDRYLYDSEMRRFRLCDKNHDDKLSPHEYFYMYNLAPFLPRFEIEYTWEQYDLNKDGKITMDEHHEHMINSTEPIPEGEEEHDRDRFRQENEDMFKLFDMNGDDLLEWYEIKNMMALDRDAQAKEHAEELIKDLDDDKDGRLSKAEFTKTQTHLISLFHDVHDVHAPEPNAEDIPGPPEEPPSIINYKLYHSRHEL